MSEDGTNEFVDVAGIGRLFNKGPRWFERHRRKLMDAGFPEPVSRNCWLRQAVKDFRDAKGRARIDAEHDVKVTVVDVPAAVRRTLARGR